MSEDRKGNSAIGFAISSIASFLFFFAGLFYNDIDNKKYSLWCVLIAFTIIVIGLYYYYSYNIKNWLKKHLLAKTKDFDFLWSFYEVFTQLETRRFISSIRFFKFSNSNKDLKQFLKEYMSEEDQDIKSQIVVTTFVNYARQVKSLIEFNQKKAEKLSRNGKKYKVFCVTQNTINFVRWFNLTKNGFQTDVNWVQYLEYMSAIATNPDVELRRYMTFTTQDVIDKAIKDYHKDEKDFPFYCFNNPYNKTDYDDIVKDYLDHISKEVFIEARTDKPLNAICGRNKKPIKEFLLTDDEIETFKTNIRSRTFQGSEYPKLLRKPLFVLSDSSESTPIWGKKRHDLRSVMIHVFNPNSSIWVKYLNDLSPFYSTNRKSITEDFFAIGIREDNIQADPEWQIVLAASMDKKIDTVKVSFVTPENRVSKDPVTKIDQANFDHLKEYINWELLSLDRTKPPMFKNTPL